LRQTVESHLLHHLAIPDTVLAITRAERLAPLNYARAFAYVHPIALAIDATDILSHSRSSSCFGSLRYGSLLIKRVTLPLRLANLFRGTSRRLIFCFSFFSTLHSYARRNHDVIVADVATSAIVYRPSVVAKFRKTAKADGALLVFHFHLALWRLRVSLPLRPISFHWRLCFYSRSAPIRGLVTSRQTFVRRCHRDRPSAGTPRRGSRLG
jgi:hypothetical protein